MHNVSNWKEFNLSELFEIETTKSFDKKNLDFAIDGDCDFVGRSSADNGIQGKMHKLNIEPNNSETFSLVQIGENIAIWRERPWYASQNIFKLTPKVDEIKKVPLFIKTAIDKSMSIYSGGVYTSYPTKKSLFETNILLPTTPSGEPDWDFMEQYIAELEEERVAELEKYLIATGLDDYELTEEDKATLSLSAKSASYEDGYSEDFDGIWWKEFRIGDLFDIFHGKRLTKADRIPGDLPLLTAGENNQGVAEFIGNEWPSYENPITIDMFGNCFYHSGLYTGDDNIYFFTNKDISEKAKLFISATLKKTLNGKYTYGKQFRQNDANTLIAKLPVLPDGTPDFEYMEKYIRAIEKLTIKGVVEWQDKKLKMLKTIVTI